MVQPKHCIVTIALVAVGACGSATTPTTLDTAGVRHRIVVLGDSLAVSPSRTQNFASELQTRLDATHPGWTIENQGVIGDTTADGLRRVDAALRADTGILILELGANDGLRGLSTSIMESNLSKIIERAQDRDVRVLLCGMETPPFNGLSYALDFHRVFPRLAERYHIPLVPFLLEGVALDPELNVDEVHPNAAGARIIAATVWTYLEPMLAQVARPAA